MRAVVTCICLLIVGSSGAFAQAPEPDIAVTPDAFDYETITVGGVRDRAFAVTNEDTTASLIIFATEIRGADSLQFRIISGAGGVILAPGATRLISVRFAPTSAGPKSAVLRIESDDPDENPFDVRLSGTGRGIPDIVVDRTTLSFGNVPVGSTSLLGVTITNQGSADLEVTETELTGEDTDQFAIADGSAPFTLAPQESVTITVSFTPSSDRGKNAVLRVSSNDPDEDSLDIILQGTGVGPEITTDVAGHDFGDVAVGASALHTFRISNTGNADLVVDSLMFLGTDPDLFQVTQEGVTPFVLSSGRSQPIIVQYAPTARGSHSAVLRFYSNDLITPQFDLVLRGTGSTPSIALNTPALDFGELPVTLDSTQTLIFSNMGGADLVVDQIVVSGGDSTQFDVQGVAAPFVLAPSDSLVLGVRFRPASAGSKSATLRIESNDPDQPQLDILLSGIGRTIEVDVAAAGLGQDVPVTVTVPPSFQPNVKELYYRSASEAVFRVIELTGTGPEFQGIIPGLTVTLTGIEYYVLFSDGTNTVTLPVFDPEGQPLFLPTRIDQMEAPVSPRAWTYQMISVPLELADQDVEAVLLDDYGPYNTRRWRLFRWENDDYVEYPAIQGSFATGVGFWLITNDGVPFDVENGQSTDPSTPFTFTLQPGWNQIGNPYAFPIAWPEETIDPRIEAPASYDGTEFQYGETVLRPWEGYFVRNLAPSPLMVSLSARASSASKSGGVAGKLAIEGGIQYRLRLFAEVEGVQLLDTQNYLGLAEAASEGHDAFDFTEAPPIGDYVRLSIIVHGERYAGNFKPADEGGQHWDLEVDGSFSGKSVRVRLASTGQLPEDYGLYVVDRDHRNALAVIDSSFSIDLREARSVRRLRILIGTRQYAEEHRDGISLVPVAFRLKQNYPNPFNPETTIRYQIGKRSPVRLEIYNLVGQRVRTLVHTTLEAGSYAARWDGRNDEGVSAASGVYMYRLRAGEFMATRKMLLIR